MYIFTSFHAMIHMLSDINYSHVVNVVMILGLQHCSSVIMEIDMGHDQCVMCCSSIYPVTRVFVLRFHLHLCFGFACCFSNL